MGERLMISAVERRLLSTKKRAEKGGRRANLQEVAACLGITSAALAECVITSLPRKNLENGSKERPLGEALLKDRATVGDVACVRLWVKSSTSKIYTDRSKTRSHAGPGSPSKNHLSCS